MKSKCCNADVKVVNGYEGTSYYSCNKCENACDPFYCCTGCNDNGNCAFLDCLCHSFKEPTSWQDRFDEKVDQLCALGTTGINTGGFIAGDIGCSDFWLEPKFIKDFITTEKAISNKEGYEKGVDDALRGEIQNMTSITFKETVTVPVEIQDHFKKLGQQEVLNKVLEEFEEKKFTVGCTDCSNDGKYCDTCNDYMIYNSGINTTKAIITKLLEDK